MVIIEQFFVIIRLFIMVVVAPGRTGRGLTLGYYCICLYASVSEDLF